MSEMSVKEAYRVLQAKFGAEVGDTLKVLRTWTRGEGGSGGCMRTESEMLSFVGKTCSAHSVWPNHVTVYIDGEYVAIPFFCLELVEKAKPKPPTNVSFAHVSFAEDGLTVGGTFVSKDTIKRNFGF